MLALITSILYIECAVVSLLVMPILSLDQWQRILHSAYIKSIYRHLKPWIYIYVLLAAGFLFNSLRLMNATIDSELFTDGKKLLQYSLNQTIAQRNFYASGISIFLLALSRQLILVKLNQPEIFLDYFNLDIEYKYEQNELDDAPTVQQMDYQSAMSILKESNSKESISKESSLSKINEDLQTIANFEEKSDKEDMCAKAQYVMGLFYEQSGQN